MRAQPTRVDASLNGNVGHGFLLKIALLGIFTLLAEQCPLNLGRMRVVLPVTLE